MENMFASRFGKGCSWRLLFFYHLTMTRITASSDIGHLDLLGDKSVSLTVVDGRKESSTGEVGAGARLTVKPNVELMAKRFTVTDTQGEEILSVMDGRVR